MSYGGGGPLANKILTKKGPKKGFMNSDIMSKTVLPKHITAMIDQSMESMEDRAGAETITDLNIT